MNDDLQVRDEGLAALRLLAVLALFFLSCAFGIYVWRHPADMTSTSDWMLGLVGAGCFVMGAFCSILWAICLRANRRNGRTAY